MSKNADFSAYQRPSTIGSGTWYSAHLMSFNLETEEDIIALYNFIQLLRRKFECITCRDHFNDFAKINDPEIAMKKDVKDLKKKRTPENLAKWLVDAHNGATKHKFDTLGKKTGQTFKPTPMSYEKVKSFFVREELEFTPCENCSDTEEDNFITSTPKQFNTSMGGSIRVSPRAKPVNNTNPKYTIKILPSAQ